MSDRIVVEYPEPHLALVRFNRPERLNAMDQAAMEALHGLVGRLSTREDLRAVVLTGTGRAFSAGADLKEMGSANPPGLRESRARLQLYQDITRRMVESPLVFVAAVNGIAVGVGAELALASDLRIGSEQAEVMFSEVSRGLFETNGVLYTLPRVVGAGRAAQWLLTGERIPAATLHGAGFLNELVGAEQLLPRALELARTIAGNAPVSVRQLKRLLRRTWDVDLETMMQYEVDGMLACLASEDIEEGLRAFAERRRPVWKGR
ncbi:MAG: enoyl-CoA hydratase/isomerase family protein [Gemmatimonadetes bacterium]|nr:enoyl-CoA hydratase/isomerase family protein [Gemmatimonadota bacterium]